MLHLLLRYSPTIHQNRIFLALFVCLLVQYPGQKAFAQRENDINNLLEMSLEELTNVVVSVSSYGNRQILDTPAIVSSYSRNELAKLGLQNLKDILSFFPGFIVNNQLSNETPIQIRGLTENNNQKILFLLDDTPIWMPSHGAIPLLGIPINLIDRVEVIRGPGSVIYGTNASAGVIKIITRKDADSETSLHAGSLRTVNSSHYLNWQIDDKTKKQVKFSFEAQREGNISYKAHDTIATFNPVTQEFILENGDFEFSENYGSAFLSYSTNKFETYFHTFKSEMSGVANGSIRSPARFLEYSYLVGGKYTHNIKNFGELSWFADYNNYFQKIEIDNLLGTSNIPGNGEISFSDSGKKNYRLRTGLKYFKQIAQDFSVFSGIEFEKRSTGDYVYRDDAGGANLTSAGFTLTPGYEGVLIFAEDNNEEKSFFSEFDYNANYWRFLAGARYVKNSKSGSKVLPRSSLVYRINKFQSLKAIYSVGFNSPTSRQSADVGPLGLVSTVHLKAETVRTFDISYTLVSKRTKLVVDIFLMQNRDIIVQKNGFFSNAENYDRTGAEIDFQFNTNNWRTYIGLSHLVGGNTEKSSDTNLITTPKWTSSFGLLRLLSSGHSIGSSLRYIGERRDLQSSSLINLSYQINNPNSALFVILDNVTNDKNRTPTFSTTNLSSAQGHRPRSINVGVKIHI